MRVIRADLSECYKVHKTYTEFLADIGLNVPDQSELYPVWMKKLTNSRYHYLLLMHGKKIVGMVWGKELQDEAHKTILIEGRFIRRAYRKNRRFLKDLVKAVNDLKSGFERVRMILPHSKVKLARKYTPLGLMVELKLGGK